MPEPLAKEVWSKRRNQDTMVAMAGGIEAADARISAPLSFREYPMTKPETWNKPRKKGESEDQPRRRYVRYVRRDPKTKRFVSKFTNTQARDFLGLRRKRPPA